MMRKLSIGVSALAVAAVGTTVAATAVSAHPSSAAKLVVKTRQVSPYGTILTTSSGRSLYLFSEDSKGHSSCNSGCDSTWPPLIVPKGDKISGVSGLDTIKRGSKRQAALNGHALYSYVGDTAAGQVKGQKVEGDWFVATPSGASHASPSKPKPSPSPSKTSPLGGGGYGY
jgi:predicted lipoprotein with Yx(FWY)xxD motif